MSQAGRFAIGIDLGGTNLRVAAVSESGELLDKVAFSVHSLVNRDGVIDELCRSVNEIAAKQKGSRTLLGVGAGIPGILYIDTGVLRKAPNLPGWENFAVRDAIQSRVGVNVFVDNDANVAALGEHWLGAGRGVTSLCLMTLGTGVGGGLVFDGKIWRGFLGMAGEIGHITVTQNGVQCGCGNIGCLETEASATALVRKAKDLLANGKSPALKKAIDGGSALTAELVYEVAQAGDAACRELFESFGKYLGLVLAMLVNTLNLPVYVIGGGVAAGWPLFAQPMLNELNRRSYIFAEKSTEIERAVLGSDAGLFGAAKLALQAVE